LFIQVVTIAVYSFFVACLFGRQFHAENSPVDTYIPIFTVFQVCSIDPQQTGLTSFENMAQA
jgi:hypothetical protein